MATKKQADEQKDEPVKQDTKRPADKAVRDKPRVDREVAIDAPDAHVEPAGPPPADGAEEARGADGLERATAGPLAQAAERGAEVRRDPDPKIDSGYADREAAALAAHQDKRPGELGVVTQEQEVRDVRSDHTPVRDQAAYEAAKANERAALAPPPPHNPPSEDPDVALDQAPVRESDAVNLPLELDDRIPVNARAMLTGDLPNGTTTCWFCGHEKPQPERPGRDQPHEYCPYCGKGSQAEEE